jgi:hypothetical protein
MTDAPFTLDKLLEWGRDWETLLKDDKPQQIDLAPLRQYVTAANRGSLC